MFPGTPWAGLSWACFCLVRGCPFAGSRHCHFPGSCAPLQLRLSLWNLCPTPRAHLCFLKSLLSGGQSRPRGAPAQQAPLSCCQCPLGFWVCASATPTPRSTNAPLLRSPSASPLLTVGSWQPFWLCWGLGCSSCLVCHCPHIRMGPMEGWQPHHDCQTTVLRDPVPSSVDKGFTDFNLWCQQAKKDLGVSHPGEDRAPGSVPPRTRHLSSGDAK